MTYESDNAESRIGQTTETTESSLNLASEAYSEMGRQQRTETRSGAIAGTPDFLIMTDPFGGLDARPPMRTDRLQPVPAPPIEIDHEAAQRAGEEGDRRAAEHLRRAGRRRHSPAPNLPRRAH